MLILPRLRSLLLALFWPALLALTLHLRPDLLERWDGVADSAALALAAVGGLIAAGFSRWRLTAAFLLVVLAGAGAFFPALPGAVALLPVLALGILPWLRERGLTGAPMLLVGALCLVLLALWLRGGEPATRLDGLLRFEPPWPGYRITATALVAATLWLALLVRLLWRDAAVDLALAGALAALLPLLHGDLTEAGRVAATSAAVLSLWTGLLLHAWRMAYRDQLTGLPNRRALEDALKALPGRWSLAMLDVDHFKQFNDKWGHDVGDQVLRRVAAVLATVGGRGRPYRYGGEEFSVLFCHDDLERAGEAIEAIREKIGATPFRVRDVRTGEKSRGQGKGRGEQRITVSAGLAAANGGTPAATFKRADQALYKAKKQGRNRLVRAQ